MQKLSSIVQYLFVTLTLSTALGVFLHDTKVDAATASAVSAQTASHSASDKLPNFTSDLHIHHERASFAVAHMQRDPSPRIQPRLDDRRYALHKKVSKRHHSFDMWHLKLQTA